MMDVDDAPNILKRCSSAPLINEATSTVATSPTTNSAPRDSSLFNMYSNSNSTSARPRRYSFNSPSLTASLVQTATSWVSGRGLANRVTQLRKEESLEMSTSREVAHEREIHTAMQMGQSCEDLSLVTSGIPSSPTRIPRFSPVVSPSPTRKYMTRRSLSPIALRASSFSPVGSGRPTMLLSGKRRYEDADSPLSKRFCGSDRLTPSTPGTPDSDSLECTFRPVSPRAQPMHADESPNQSHNHKSDSPS